MYLGAEEMPKGKLVDATEQKPKIVEPSSSIFDTAGKLLTGAAAAYRELSEAKRKPAPVIVQQQAPVGVSKFVTPIMVGIAGLVLLSTIRK